MSRDIFVAAEGCVLLSGDYSQIEIRYGAGVSKDPDMLDLFYKGIDLHLATAKLISMVAWGIKPEEVTKAHRYAAKTTVFGLFYGKDAYGIAYDLGCSVKESEKIVDAILGKFKVFAKWREEKVRQAQLSGEVWIEWNGKPARRRPLWRIASQDDSTRKTAERGAYNSPIQGGANEYGVMSMTAMVDWIKEERFPAKVVLPVHDDIMSEVKKGFEEELAYHQNRIMTSFWTPENVPLVVNFEYGRSWGSLAPLGKA